MRRADGLEDIAAGTRAGKDQAGGVELLECGSVMGAPAALVVGRIGAADVGAFRPGEAEPAQVLEHRVDEIEAEADRVEVVIAQDERAAGLAGAFRGDPERARMAEVEVAGGRGREASAIGEGRHFLCVRITGAW